MTAIVTDMSHVYEEEYALFGLDYNLVDKLNDFTAQNALMRAYAAGRGWETRVGNDDFIHDEDKFREALRYLLQTVTERDKFYEALSDRPHDNERGAMSGPQEEQESPSSEYDPLDGVL